MLTDNPHESSRNQVGIRVGAKGGSADDVATARTDLISDYYDSDVSVFAPTDTTDAEEEYVVEGEYGRFIVTRMRGEDTPMEILPSCVIIMSVIKTAMRIIRTLTRWARARLPMMC